MLLISLASLATVLLSVEVGAVHHRYCVVGAGPAGAQLGKFFVEYNQDAIIFERNDAPGSFFKKYPIHRKLISINKRFTGFDNLEFNMRHDWNSLLNGTIEDPYAKGPLPFTKWTEEFFPHADVFVDYIKDYAESIHHIVKYNANVVHIAKPAPERFVLSVVVSGTSSEYTCDKVIIAAGIDVPKKLNVPGGHLATEYKDISPHGKDFENLRVAIIGGGNTAHEISQALHGYSAHNHLLTRGPIKLAFFTHYVGDIRAVNIGTLDTYQLKSLDAQIETHGEFSLVRCQVDPRNPTRPIKVGTGDKICTMDADFDELSPEKKQEYLTGKFEYDPLRVPYDMVISAIGWTFNTTIFDASTAMPEMNQATEGKFPAMDCNFQSTNVPGMYFAGVLTHSRDLKRSAGGFIHGYRYLARTLFKILMRDDESSTVMYDVTQRIKTDTFNLPADHGTTNDPANPSIHQPLAKPWLGSRTIPLDAHSLFKQIRRRYQESSGLYQMFGELVDVILLNPRNASAEYLEEVPRCQCAPPIDAKQQLNWHRNTNHERANFARAEEYFKYKACAVKMDQDDSDCDLRWEFENGLEPEDQEIVDAERRGALDTRLSCATCDDRFDRLVVTFKYADNFSGPKTIEENRIGAHSFKNAHESTFLHPVIEFFPSALRSSMKEPQSLHLVEDVQALWGSEFNHLEPLMIFLTDVVLNTTIAAVKDEATHGFLETAGGKQLVQLAGATPHGHRMKQTLMPGQPVVVLEDCGVVSAGMEGVFVNATDGVRGAMVRFPELFDKVLPMYFHGLDIPSP